MTKRKGDKEKKRKRDKETKRQKDEKTDREFRTLAMFTCKCINSAIFYFNECNFTIVKLNAFNKHTKKQCYLALGRHTKLLFLDNGIDGATCMKRKQSKCNE